MKEYKLTIQKGNGYFDPKLNVNINSPHGSKKITEEDILNKDVDNINFAVRTGVLNMVDLETGEHVSPKEIKAELIEDDQNIIEETDTEENEVEEIEIETEKTESEEEDKEEEVEEKTEEPPTCQAMTSTGAQCSNRAVYPEDDPQYCHISSHQKEYNREE